MRIEFPYPGYEEIAGADIADERVLAVLEPRRFPERDGDELIARAIAAPIGAPALRSLVQAGMRVLVLIDDGTRRTPVAQILPHVLDELAAGGVDRGSVELLQAPGTHRPMTDAELAAKLGALYGRLRVHEHHWLDRAALHDFGTTRDGTRVTANRLLADADFVLGIGAIVPHRVKGMSGGAKIAFPGVSGPEMMERNQWEASMHMSATVMGEPENPMRLRMEEAAALAGLRYIVNVVLDADDRVAACVAGDVVQAHREGCRHARDVYAAALPHRADIVLVDAYPADRDLWQSIKGPYAATIAVRDGGSLIVVAPNPEGVARNHGNLLDIGYRPHAELIRMVEDGGTDDLVGLAILADLSQIVDRCDCIMVSPGVPDADARRLGFRPAATVQEALDLAFERQGGEAQVAVLRQGGHILPVLEDAA